MKAKRRDLISSIYDHISSNTPLTSENILKSFNPNEIDIYKTGKVTKLHIKQQLISLFSLPDGQLTKEEFIAFYDDLSVNYPHDQPFLKYISLQQNFVIQNTRQDNQQEFKAVIKAFRFKLIQKSKVTNDQFLLKRLFCQYDQNNNGYISSFQLDLMLKKLQLPILQHQLQPLFSKLYKNCSGFIEYQQFKRFIFFDPYPV